MSRKFFLFGFTIILFLGFFFSVSGQVTVSQEFVDDANRAFEEVVALRDSLEKFKQERAKTEIERQTSDALIKGLNDLIGIKDRTISEYQKLVEFQQKIITFQQQIIEKLQTMLNKPKSAFQKFLKGVMEVLKAGVFILIGRGLTGI